MGLRWITLRARGWFLAEGSQHQAVRGHSFRWAGGYGVAAVSFVHAGAGLPAQKARGSADPSIATLDAGPPVA